MSGATAAAASGAFAATSGGGNLRQQEQRAPSGPRPPHPPRALRGTGLTAARQVWELTDTKKCGFLDLREFEAALKLIALAQRNGGSVDYAVSAEVLRGGGPPVGLPRLQGLETEAAAPPSPAPGPSPAGASGAQWPPLSEAEVEKYKGLFRSLDPAGQGVVQGGAVFPVFMQSGLPKDRLKAIWDLVAGDRGYLSLPELITSLYLVQAALAGRPLPAALPPPPFPPMAGPAAAAAAPPPPPAVALPAVNTAPPPNYAQLYNAQALPAAAAPTPAAPTAWQSKMPPLDPAMHGQLDAAQQRRLEELRSSTAAMEKQQSELEAAFQLNREKEKFYQASLQQLVMFKSRTDAALVELNERFDRDKADVEKLEQAFAERRGAAEAAQQALAARQAELDGAFERKLELKAQLEELGGAVSGGRLERELAEKVAAEEREVAGLQERFDALELERQRAQGRADELLQRHAGARAALQQQIDGARVVIEAAKIDGDNEARALEGLQAQAGAVEAEAAAGQAALGALLDRAAAVVQGLSAKAAAAGVALPEGLAAGPGPDLAWRPDAAKDAAAWDFDFEDAGFTVVKAFDDVAGAAEPAAEPAAPFGSQLELDAAAPAPVNGGFEPAPAAAPVASAGDAFGDAFGAFDAPASFGSAGDAPAFGAAFPDPEPAAGGGGGGGFGFDDAFGAGGQPGGGGGGFAETFS